MKKIYGMSGVEMRAYGQKLVKFCTHTHTYTDRRVNLSSIDEHSDCINCTVGHNEVMTSSHSLTQPLTMVIILFVVG